MIFFIFFFYKSILANPLPIWQFILKWSCYQKRMAFLHQYPIIIPFISILAAETLKVSIDLFTKRSKLRFINPGGMPSGHSAFVGSLVVVVAYREGIDSTAFMISAVVALIVMYDAVTLSFSPVNRLRLSISITRRVLRNPWAIPRLRSLLGPYSEHFCHSVYCLCKREVLNCFFLLTLKK